MTNCPTIDPPADWMSRAQLADWWGVHTNTVSRRLAELRANSGVPLRRVGTRWCVADILAAMSALALEDDA
jgi:hypothetical protein